MLKSTSLVVGIHPDFRKFLNPDFGKTVRMAQEIGELVGHSTNTLLLTPYFGRVLAYHGDFAGLPWPTSRSLYGRRLRGARVPDIKEDLKGEYITLLYHGDLIKYKPDFFIITAFDEFEKQSELKETISANYPVLVQTEDYLIYDLRERLDRAGNLKP